MRKKGRSALVVVGAVAAGGIAVAVLWFRADAAPSRVEALQQACIDDRAYHRRALALRELVEIDSSESRAALASLADAADERLATQALAALGRADHADAKAKLHAVFESGQRSDLSRSTALGALCHAEKADGKDWEDLADYVEEKAGENARLQAMAASLASGFSRTTGGGR